MIPMRSFICMVLLLSVSGCSHPEGVRQPVPGAVAAWWAHVRELNKPDPIEMRREEFLKMSLKNQRRYASKLGYY